MLIKGNSESRYKDETKPHIKITISRMNSDDGEESIHYLFSSGLYNSQKNTGSEDLIIGRQVVNGNDIRPNDILLPAKDRAVSRIHGKFIYKNGFPNFNGKISEMALNFLLQTHPRLGKDSPGRNIPFNISKHILEYARGFKLN